MTVKKKRLLIITCLCVLLLATLVTFLLGNWNSLFQSAPKPISFSDAVSAQAEFNRLSMDGETWGTIKMDFPDESSAKKLYDIESWANNYQYDPDIMLIRWKLSVTYKLRDGGTVTRRYEKADWDEMLADFIKANEQYVTEKSLDMQGK